MNREDASAESLLQNNNGENDNNEISIEGNDALEMQPVNNVERSSNSDIILDVVFSSQNSQTVSQRSPLISQASPRTSQILPSTTVVFHNPSSENESLLSAERENEATINPPQESQLYQNLCEGKIKLSVISNDTLEIYNIENNETKSVNITDFEKRNEDSNFWIGLHFACSGSNVAVLKTLLSISTKANKNATTIEGYTPLHVLLQYGEYGDEMIECVKALLEDTDVDYNQTDYNRNIPPLFLAVEYEYVDIIKLFLEKPNIDICRYTKGKHICNSLLGLGFYVKCNNRKDRHVPKDTNIKQESTEQQNIQHADIVLKKRNELINLLKDKKQEEFMHKIVKLNLNDIEEFEKDSNITFLQLAVFNKLETVVRLLLRKGVSPIKNFKTYPIKPLDIAIKYKYCLIVNMFINRPDMKEDAKYAWNKRVYKSECSEMVKYYLENPEYIESIKKIPPICKTNDMVLTLLEKKFITLTQLDSEGSKYIETLSLKAVKAHFASCFTNYEPGKKDNGKFLISYDCEYGTIIPHKNNNTKSYSELELISYIIKNRPDLHDLLHHPGIKAFLFLKWHRIRVPFALILAIYLAFIALVVSYMYLEWKMELIQYILIFIIIIVLIFELFQIYITKKNESESNNSISSFINIRLVLIIVFIILLLICSTHEWTKSVMLLLTTFDFMFYIGNHPALSAQVRMLQTVAFTYMKFLSFYSILMAAFALSFHINFRDNIKNNMNITSNNTFAHISTSAFKTVIMLAGEFEAGTISFDNSPIIGHLLFLFFVILIVIILMNLLNGLAVSDTAKVIKQSKFYGVKSQVEFIVLMESFYYFIINYRVFKTILSYFYKDKLFIFLNKKQENMKIKVEIKSNKCYLTVDGEEKIFYTKNASKMRILKHLKIQKQNNLKRKAESKDECEEIITCPYCKHDI